MRIKSKGNKVFGIIGLPRTGTTLLNNIFNSYENCISVSEPHWKNILLNGKPDRNKLKSIPVDLSQNSKVIPNLQEYVEETTDIMLGGVKETFRSHQRNSVDFVLKSERVNFIVGIIRKPQDAFDSWIRSGWGGKYTDVRYFTQTYKDFYNTLNKSRKKIFWIKYEDLCKEPSGYLDKEFGDYLSFDDLERIEKTEFRIGDMKANAGGKVFVNEKKSTSVPENQIEFIKEELHQIMEEFGYL